MCKRCARVCVCICRDETTMMMMKLRALSSCIYICVWPTYIVAVRAFVLIASIYIYI